VKGILNNECSGTQWSWGMRGILNQSMLRYTVEFGGEGDIESVKAQVHSGVGG